MKIRICDWFKNNYCLIIVLIIGLIVSCLALNELGFNYTINSDDLSYINSGITFFESGTVTMHGPVSAQIMPGLTYIIATFCLLFKTGSLMIISLKIFYIFMFLITIIYIYKIIKLYSNQFVAGICSLLMFTPDFIWTNNLILTETPYILFQTILIYYSLTLAKDKNILSYIMIIISYICCLFIRPTIALFPIFLFIFLILKKYNLKKLIIQGIIALGILLCVLTPWIIRNYKQFNEFIPLTYGMGNPLLLGTYQGYDYPLDEQLDYKENVYDKLNESEKFYLDNPDENPKWTKYYSLKYDELVAKYRIKEWWQNNKLSMLKSYFVFKPKILLATTFYWEPIFNISEEIISLFHKVFFIIFSILSLIILIVKKHRKELLFLGSFYLYNIALYSYSFAYGRYALTMYPIRYIIIGIGIGAIIKYIKERKQKNAKN